MFKQVPWGGATLPFFHNRCLTVQQWADKAKCPHNYETDDMTKRPKMEDLPERDWVQIQLLSLYFLFPFTCYFNSDCFNYSIYWKGNESQFYSVGAFRKRSFIIATSWPTGLKNIRQKKVYEAIMPPKQTTCGFQKNLRGLGHKRGIHISRFLILIKISQQQRQK